MRTASIFIALLCLSFLGYITLHAHAVSPGIMPVAKVSSTSPTVLATPTPSSKITVSGIVVPHHDLVKAQRDAFFAEFSQQITAPKTVILVSPNHYNSGRAVVQTTQQSWSLADGEVQPNAPVISQLIAVGVGDESESFTNEHGIRLVLPNILKSFPGATIVPIIIKSSATLADVSQLEKVLEQMCASCLMVSSVDFSHYQPAQLASVHDTVSERALDNRDIPALMHTAEVDSPAALALLATWAEAHGTQQFVLQNYTSADVLLNTPDAPGTTHLYGWYQAGSPTVPKASVSFLIGGDMMFGRMIAHTFLAKGLSTALDKLGPRLFWGTDAGIVNLEGPVSNTPVPDDITANNLRFNFPPQSIDALKYLKVNAASQANNHSANAGAVGLSTTRSLLAQADIQAFGGPGDQDITRVATFKGQTYTLYMIGVHTLESEPDLTPLITSLKKDPDARVLIFPHWGTEYQPVHSSRQEREAHAWIEAGADCVIGAHPHVIEDGELYKGKPIVYSMGNLLFDQTFSAETQQGLIMGGEFTEAGLRLFALPVQSSKLKPALAVGDEKTAIINKLYQPFSAYIQTSPLGTSLFFPSAVVH